MVGKEETCIHCAKKFISGGVFPQHVCDTCQMAEEPRSWSNFPEEEDMDEQRKQVIIEAFNIHMENGAQKDKAKAEVAHKTYLIIKPHLLSKEIEDLRVIVNKVLMADGDSTEFIGYMTSIKKDFEERIK